MSVGGRKGSGWEADPRAWPVLMEAWHLGPGPAPALPCLASWEQSPGQSQAIGLTCPFTLRA